jgi:hypothetical protein
MAQIIKHRRGTLAELNGVVLNNGELGIVTGSVTIGDSPIKTAIVVGNTDGTNRLSLARLAQGSGSATLVGKTGGANWNDMIYYDTNDYKLQTLHSTNGVSTLNLTGNISATEIAGNISGSLTSTGSFGYLNVVGDAIIGGNLTFGDANTDNVSFGADISSSLIPNNDDKFDLGSSGQQWKDLYIDGTANIDSLAADSAAIGDLTSGRVVVAGASGELQDDSDLTFSGDTLTATKIGAFQAVGAINFDSQNLTNVNINSGTVDAITSLTVGNDVDVGNYKITSKALEASDLTAGRVTFAGTNGLLADDSDLTFSTATLSATNLTTTGTIKDFSVASGSLTSSGSFGYVNALSGVNAGNVNVGISGLNEIDTDSGNLTLDSTGGEVIVDDVLRVTGNTQLSGSLLIEDAAATITHEGATSLTISSTNGTVLVEGSVFTGDDLEVPGNLTVSGTTTTIDSTTLNIGDNIIVLNAAGAVVDSGLQVVDAAGTTHTGSLLWNATNDYWYSGISGSTHYRHPVQSTASDLTDNRVVISQGDGRIESSTAITDDGTTVDISNRLDAQASLVVTGSVYATAGASVAAASASLVSFRNDSDDQFGYLASADTQAVTTGLVGYNTSTGNLTISSVVDGGSF